MSSPLEAFRLFRQMDVNLLRSEHQLALQLKKISHLEKNLLHKEEEKIF